MKKSLLFSAALVAAASSFAFQHAKPVLKSNDMFSVGPKASSTSAASAGLTRAYGSMDFSYAQGLYGALSINGTTAGKSRVYMAFEMTPEDIKTYAGNQVTGFTVFSPCNDNRLNPISEARFFYTTTFESEDYAQDFPLSKTGYDSNIVTLDTPYTITGEEETLVFGYSIVAPSGNVYYLPVDGQANDNPGSCMFGVSSDDTLPSIDQWNSASSSYGALCMYLKIEGDNLPENIAVIDAVDTPMYLPISGEGVDVPLLVRNGAPNPISSVEITVSMTGTPDVVQSFDVASLGYNESSVLVVNGVKGAICGFGTLDIRVSKVNGEEKDNVSFTAKVPAYDNGYLTKVVAEDATGTWCGWCPGGIEALEYLKSTYPDRAIAIGAHNDDAMAIPSYQDYILENVDGFPNVMYNRAISQTPTGNYSDVCAYIDDVMAFLDYPSYANVELSGVTNDDNSAVEVNAKTTFTFNTDITHYLSFVIVEDGVGPYIQQNYFFRNQYGLKMNGWESSSSRVATVFNDVARCYVEYPGIKNSLPANIEADVVNEFAIELPIKNVKNNEYRVIAFVTNAQNGYIVNACEIKMQKNDATTGVADMVEENAPVEYFNLNGVKVANPTEGIFIRRQGGKAEKVIMK